MGDPNHEYRIAAGGRCYTIDEVWTAQMQIVECPSCFQRFRTLWAYEQHYQAIHRGLMEPM